MTKVTISECWVRGIQRGKSESSQAGRKNIKTTGSCLLNGKIFIKASGVQTRQIKRCPRRSTELTTLSAHYVTAFLTFIFCSVCTLVDGSLSEALRNIFTFCKQEVFNCVFSKLVKAISKCKKKKKKSAVWSILLIYKRNIVSFMIGKEQFIRHHLYTLHVSLALYHSPASPFTLVTAAGLESLF